MNKEKKSKKKLIILSIIVLFFISMFGIAIGGMMHEKNLHKIVFERTQTEVDKDDTSKYNKLKNKNSVPKSLKNNREIEFDQNNLDVEKEANVKVNVGYHAINAEDGNSNIGREDESIIPREYWSYTNKNEQIAYAHADEVVLQDQSGLEKDFTDDGRYVTWDEFGDTHTEQSSPGVTPGYDAGHILADSLGGNSTTYNITAQNSYLNESGMVRVYETDISKHHGAYDFSTSFTYDDKESLIPIKYNVTYFTDDDDHWTYNDFTFSNVDERLYT